ncbi:PREDICTED: replication protein A 70 kDa DNA-binding subunit B-like [Nicotiana attenuata]|nr:PREDICTED: replication protein A 70 kDa DNA-binding subunit B-like [Nicotiana attenuata]XP_019238220.1 PREDICTED: replication protein A 70 kDa DNA-binding subunit B-like [Nicotiana attenuata]
MAERLGICAITPTTPNWTCKVQVVDICRPGESSDRKIKYLNMIFQDEQEDQIKAIIYGDDIPNYEKIFRLFHTYLITGARIQLPNLRYEKSLHTFEWVIDKKTIIDPIDKDNSDEEELPPPTKLTVTSFRDIKDQASRSIKNPTKNVEHNVLAIVVKCFPPRYVASLQKRLQELIIIDTRKQTFTFTIWEEGIIEDEGKKLLGQFQEYPIILARRTGVSKYNGTSLTTRFNTTIQINPPYQQCLQLRKWIVENKEMLASFIVRSTFTSGSLISIPVDEEIVSIANVQSHQD